MNLLWIVLRSIMSGVASVMMRTATPQGPLFNIIIGVGCFP